MQARKWDDYKGTRFCDGERALVIKRWFNSVDEDAWSLTFEELDPTENVDSLQMPWRVTRFDELYKTACFWRVNETSKDGHVYDLGLCKFVEYFHVFPTSFLRRRKGPAVPARDLQNIDGDKIDWRHILSIFFNLGVFINC